MYYLLTLWNNDITAQLLMNYDNLQDARRAKKWQNTQELQAIDYICQFDKSKQRFVCIDSQITLKIKQSCYTDEYWAALKSEFGDACQD